MKNQFEKITGGGLGYYALALVSLVWFVASLAGCTPAAGGGGGKPPDPCGPQIIYLRAEATSITMPDNRVVPMWGYAQDSAFNARDGEVKVPGPVISLAACSTTLTIMLDNNLPEATSLVVNGQIQAMTPERNPDGRVRSFTHETLPGNATPGVYQWDFLKPGTFLYMSGTHPAVQEQMGLYGALVKTADKDLAYPGVGYKFSLTLVLSEVDADFHDAVATGNYGPGLAVTSPIDYRASYLLVNGDASLMDGMVVPPALASKDLLVRLVNAGSKSHAPMVLGGFFQVVAEDGNPYQYPRTRSTLDLAAGKTLDVKFTPPPTGSQLILDRRYNNP